MIQLLYNIELLDGSVDIRPANRDKDGGDVALSRYFLAPRSC